MPSWPLGGLHGWKCAQHCRRFSQTTVAHSQTKIFSDEQSFPW